MLFKIWFLDRFWWEVTFGEFLLIVFDVTIYVELAFLVKLSPGCDEVMRLFENVKSWIIPKKVKIIRIGTVKLRTYFIN